METLTNKGEYKMLAKTRNVELPITATPEDKQVKKLLDKIDPYHERNIHRIVILHDHERLLLSRFILKHESFNKNAIYAKNNEDYNFIDLSRDALNTIVDLYTE